MPGAGRTLLLPLGHATNEINVFQKLLILKSGQGSYAPRFVDQAQDGQTLTAARPFGKRARFAPMPPPAALASPRIRYRRPEPNGNRQGFLEVRSFRIALVESLT